MSMYFHSIIASLESYQSVDENENEDNAINDEAKHIIPKIMIVDDQDYNINAIAIILKYLVRLDPKVQVDKALNGHEALDLVIKDIKQNQYQRCNYTLILMDCNMPFMDGYQSTIKIR